MALREPSAGTDVLARAVAALRTAEAEQPADAGWPQLAAQVMSLVRRQQRRGHPVRANVADLPSALQLGPADTIAVSDQVVLAAIRMNLRRVRGVAPSRILLRLRDGSCAGVELDLVAGYRTDIAAAVGQARAATLAALDDLLGLPASPVDILVVDVTPLDPRL